MGEVELAEDPDEDKTINAEPGMPSGPMSESPEAWEATMLPSPVRPSAEAIERHKSTHLPYRSWCPVCVKSEGKENAHYRKKKRMNKHTQGNTLPKMSLDYQEL